MGYSSKAPALMKDKMCLKGNVVRSSQVLAGGLHAGGVCGLKSDGRQLR